MRFPVHIMTDMIKWQTKNWWRGRKRYPFVLMLEPLHTCNLTCTGCGRIREYSTSLKDVVPLEKCLAVAEECGAPMVSICGGEPLIYPPIKELVAGLLAQGRIVYICTNGLLMRKKLREYLAALSAAEAQIMVEDGRALVEAATRLRPDVIVADISMPGLNGIEAAALLRCMSGSTCEYTSSVRLTDEWPSSSLTTFGWTPRRSSSVAAVWRRS